MIKENWVNINDLSAILGVLRETLRRNCVAGKYIYKVQKSGKNKIYYILLSTLPEDYQNKYIYNSIQKDNNLDLEIYSNAPEWARKQADKYLYLINLTAVLSHKEVKNFLSNWNKENPDKKSSYQSLMSAKKKYELNGVAGLLSQNGKRKGSSRVKEDYFQYFKSLYLKEGAPSAFICWRMTFGYARQFENSQVNEFPSWWSFERKLKNEIPQQAIYLARYGQQAWNKKYAKYVSRDYSDIVAGAFWVSDHAQIDVAVIVDGKVCFPWVTVFRDVKTSKWLGWHLHFESPNSDHIFQSFYYAVLAFGLPSDIYLDKAPVEEQREVLRQILSGQSPIHKQELNPAYKVDFVLKKVVVDDVWLDFNEII